MGGALGYMQCEGVHRPPESGPDMADCGDMSGHRSYTQLSAQRPTSAGHSDDEHCCVAAESRGCFFAQVPGGNGPLVPSIPIGPRISGSSGRLGPPLGAHSLCRCDGFTPDGTDHSEGTDDNDRKDWKDMLACFASSRGGDSSASTGPARGVHRRASPSPRGLRADKGPEMTSSPRAISVQQERRSGEEADWFAACRSIPDLCAANPSDPFPLAFLPAGLVSQCDGGDLPIEHETVTERYDRRRQVTGAVCIQVHYEAETPHEDVFDLRDGEGGRLFVASLRLAGTADRMGIRVGDELVSIKVGDEPPERPDCGADSLKGIRGPVVLLFMSFAGKFPAEVRLKRPTWSGLRTTAEVFGGSSFDLCEQIVFRPEMAPLFFARKPQDDSESTKETAKSNGTATTPLLYEVRRHEAKRMVHRAITEASPGSRMSMNKLSLNAPRQGGGAPFTSSPRCHTLPPAQPEEESEAEGTPLEGLFPRLVGRACRACPGLWQMSPSITVLWTNPTAIRVKSWGLILSVIGVTTVKSSQLGGMYLGIHPRRISLRISPLEDGPRKSSPMAAE